MTAAERIALAVRGAGRASCSRAPARNTSPERVSFTKRTPLMAVISRGLEGIIAAETRIGDVRGDIGQLIYCGYDINELAGKVSYEEVVHLLWHNRLPTAPENSTGSPPRSAPSANCRKGVIDWIARRAEDRRADRHHAHRGEHARLLPDRPPRSRHAGKPRHRHQARGADRRHRRVFPSRAHRQGAAADPQGSRAKPRISSGS